MTKMEIFMNLMKMDKYTGEFFAIGMESRITRQGWDLE